MSRSCALTETFQIDLIGANRVVSDAYMKASAILFAIAFPIISVLVTVTTGTATRSATFATPVASPTPTPRLRSQVLFDDFSYINQRQMRRHGWIVRTKPGWPGVPGATWSADGVIIVKDPERPANRILRMTSATEGPDTKTTQTQICHERKYLDGTYAARVRFSDTPVTGPAGDQIVESFYTIAPLKAPMDPDYSELDYEYLPNGGWGISGPTFYATTWYTFSPEPNWKKDNVFQTLPGTQAGWHSLVTQVMDGKVRYFVDGKLFVEHGDKYYPRDIMSINFNLWFIRDGMVKSSEARQYQEDIDWVFFQAHTALTPEQVESTVARLRRQRIAFRDTVPQKRPALESPCNF